MKHSKGKLRYELDWHFIEQMAQRMQDNKGKYKPYNWTKKVSVDDLIEAMTRHLVEVRKGNYSDDGRPYGHLESIALNAMFINYQLKNYKNDRRKKAFRRN
jgi:hypothetical protein